MLQIPTSFHDALTYVSDAVEKEVRAYFLQKKAKSKAIAPELVETMALLEEYMLRGGKYVRPFLAYLSYTLAGGKSEAIFQAGAALDAFHHYVLNIDDMADKDILRRGKPTLEIEYQQEFADLTLEKKQHFGRSFSEVTGAVLEACAVELLLSCQEDAIRKNTAQQALHHHMIEITSSGWQIHLRQNLVPLAEATEQEFIKGLELVNSHYTFIGPLLVGTALAGNSAFDSVLTEYGRLVGIAFQLHDDYLGLFGDTQETGKAVGNDVREGKKTILMQYAYAHAATPSDKKILSEMCGKSTLSEEEVHMVQKIVRTSGAVEYSQHMAAQYVQQGLQVIKDLPQPHKQLFTELAEFVIHRTT